jgi:hypothetical protein
MEQDRLPGAQLPNSKNYNAFFYNTIERIRAAKKGYSFCLTLKE